MMVCASAGLMRTSEIFAKNKQVKPHKTDSPSTKALWNRNLTPYRDKKTQKISHYGCTVRATKTEKGYCDVEIVWAKGPWPVSPAELMTRYLQARIQKSYNNPNISLEPTAPLFQLDNGAIVTIKDMKKRFNILAKDMQLDLSKYNLYSFRIGGATSMARRGIDHRMIQVAGRWRSQAYALYIRMTPSMMARNQSAFLEMEVTNPELVFLHENIPNNMLVQA